MNQYNPDIISDSEFEKVLKGVLLEKNKPGYSSNNIQLVFSRLEIISDHVFNNSPLNFEKKSFDSIRAFEEYDDSRHFIHNTELGRKIFDVFYYFAHYYKEDKK